MSGHPLQPGSSGDSMPRVESKLTNWTSPAVFSRDIVRACMAAGLGIEAALILAAHVALSTGWGKATHNFNLCGIKATEADPYALLEGFECSKDGKQQPKRPMRWRVFASLEEGVRGVLGLLQKPRYAKSLAFLLAGNQAYWMQVGVDGWYTSPTSSTAAQMKSRWKQIVGFCNVDPELHQLIQQKGISC